MAVPAPPRRLGLALLAACVYAAFAGGAITSPQEPRLQVAVAAIAALASVGALWTGSLRTRIAGPAAAAVAVLAAFAAWSGLSIVWSVAPQLSWLQFNRVFAYTLVVGLALLLGGSLRHCARRVQAGLVTLTALLVAYGLAQKLIPGVRLFGLVDFNQTGTYGRLDQPLGYWNALALLLAIGAPALLDIAADAGRPARGRIAGLLGLELTIVTIGFTQSRGGFVAVAVALAVTIALSARRLAMLGWTAGALAAAVPTLVVALGSDPLTADGVPLARREHAGWLLAIALVSVAVLVVLAGRWWLAREARAAPNRAPRDERVIWRRVGVGAVVGIVALVIAVALSRRGLIGEITHVWGSFTQANAAATGPGRLFSDESANRYAWWVQAWRAFVARPVIGWGAGSFRILDLIFRRDGSSAVNAHSVPLEWLAETGFVGALLAATAWGLLLRCGWRALRRMSGADRAAAVVLFAAAATYTLHACYDWDWDIPGVTLPVLIALGVLAGTLGAPPGRARADLVRPHNTATSLRSGSPSTGGLAGSLPAGAWTGSLPAGVLVLATLLLCAFAASAALPSLAASRASEASVAAARSTPASLRLAARDASLAASLDPLSDAGPLVSATIGQQLGRPRLARAYLLEGLRREPDDWSAWYTLSTTDMMIHRDREALAAAQRVLELNPKIGDPDRSAIIAVATAAQVALARPAASPSGLATP